MRETVTFTLRLGGDRNNADDWMYEGPESVEAEARESFASCLAVRPFPRPEVTISIPTTPARSH